MVNEILMRMGLDGTGVSRTLRGLKHQITEWKNEVKESLAESFKTFAAPLTGAGVIETLKHTGETIKQIKADAQALGVSTDFIQDIRNVAEESGIAGDEVSGMLQRFIKTVPAGSDVEQAFYKMADRLSSIQDPAERAREAINLFGRSGVQMLKIVGEGSEGIKKLSAEFSKFSEKEIDDFERSSKEIEKAQNKMTIFVGHMVGAWSELWRALGAMSVTGSFKAAEEALVGSDMAEEKARNRARAIAQQAQAAESARQALAKYNEHLLELASRSKDAKEKLAALEQQLEKAQAALGDSQTTEEYYKALSKIADLEQERNNAADEANKAQEEADKKHLDQLEQQRKLKHELAQADKENISQNTALTTAHTDRSRFSLQELASLGADRFSTPEMIRQIIGARQVQFLEARGRLFAAHGLTDQSQELFNRADQIRGGLTALTEHDRFPFKTLEKAALKTEEHLSELVSEARHAGIPVSVVMGE